MALDLNILLVEDDFEIGKWLEKRILNLNNIKSLFWETTLHKATNAINLNNPDIIVLDLNLPDGNGIELLKTLKRKQNQTKVYIFSINSELKKTCLRLGADAFFDKTTDSENLIASLSQLRA
ncbi:response regulator [Mariniflexile sp.]|uniref:response regulator n=1 Tax=Mariniflexile sp. TaxID=1979402 RepID=UPI0035643F02